MKKMIIPLATFALLFCGCGDVYRTYETYEIVKPGVDMYTVNLTIPQNTEWFESGTECYEGYYVYRQFEIDQITQEVFKDGAVLVYLVNQLIDLETKKPYYVDNILPYVHSRDIYDNNDNFFQIIQNVRYEVEPGLLTIIVEWADNVFCPLDKMDFKVCILSPGAK